MPHRPASFPSHLPASHTLPTSGHLTRITDFPLQPYMSEELNDMYGCEPILNPGYTSQSYVSDVVYQQSAEPDTRSLPEAANQQPRERKIALVLRGRCPFSFKVLSAQKRGADAVIVADDAETLIDGSVESEQRGRMRTALLTMYSPGEYDVCVCVCVCVYCLSGSVIEEATFKQRIHPTFISHQSSSPELLFL